MPEETALSEKGTDTNLNSPSESFGFFRSYQFWKRTLTNNDFLGIYKRQGVGYKATNKLSNDIFDEVFTTENPQFKNAIEFYNLHEVNRAAYKNARVSGKVLIFIGYSDTEDDLNLPANTSSKINYFYTLPWAWVEQDKYYDNKINDFYKIYSADGNSFKVHESRFIRYENEGGISSFEPAYNSLYVTDNILWSVGQTMWRVGQGFPVITVKDPKENIDGAGTNEITHLRKTGILRDISSESGFIGDDRYKFEFAGANGVALKPREYYDIAFQEATMALEVPAQLLTGTAAGAVTGSETNLKDYYSDISSKQKRDVQPLYKFQAELLGITVNDDDFNWQPLFELDQKEISETFNKDSQSMGILVDKGILTEEQAFDSIKTKYPELPVEQFDKSASEEKKKANFSFNRPFNNTDSILTPNTSGPFKDPKFKKKVKFTPQDPKISKVETSFDKTLKKKFDVTRRIITAIIEGFNTDAVTENNVLTIKNRINSVIKTEKDVYKDIVDKFINQSFDTGLDKAKQDLVIDNSLIDFKKADKAKKILASNDKEIVFSLLDDIDKEIGLLLTDVSLNGLPISNKAFKDEITSVFDKKLGRLNAGVVTETNRAFNNGLIFGFDQSGLVTHKIWRSVIDDRTTAICQHLNGEITGLGQPFSTGDFDAPAHINCRSSVEPLTLTPNELDTFKQ